MLVGLKKTASRLAAAAGLVLSLAVPAAAQMGEALPTGQRLTPTAARGAQWETLDPGLRDFPDYRAGQAVALALSPDGATLLVLTSGFNRLADQSGRRAVDASREYVFVYDVTAGAPRQRQVIMLANTFQGIAWYPDGSGFAVSGGVDDSVYGFARDGAGFVETLPPIALGHTAGLGLGTKPLAAGIAASADGTRLLVANYQNDSVSLIDLGARRVLHELDLRPGKLDARRQGVPGGEFPLALAWASPSKAYVASERDREIVILALAEDRLAVTGRLKLAGQPTALLLDRRGRLFVAQDNSDSVAIIDTAEDKVSAEFSVIAPPALLANPRRLRGAGPNALALSPDERTLFVSLGGLNAVAVVSLAPAAAVARRGGDDDDKPPAGPYVVGLLPTGWYPTGLTIARDGERLYVVNGKSNAGPNPGACRDTAVAYAVLASCIARNRYVWQLEHAGLLSMPMPDARELTRLTWQVAANDNFTASRRQGRRDARMAFLRRSVKHVIYVVKENRSYDQLFGDLDRGNGDPRLVLFGASLTPNHHRLARQFVTLDAFFDSGETSNNGWLWTTAARSTDFMEKEAPINYAGRGLQYDSEGLNRNINVALPQDRRPLADPDELPGTADIAAPDAADGTAGAGYLWDAALKAGLSLRNYGFFGDFNIYDPRRPDAVPLIREPFAQRRPVFSATKTALVAVSDPFYRGFDMRFPDVWRIKEWQRDLADLVHRNAMPRLMLVRLPNDHFGNFGEGIDGVSTVETQMADNDYALGLLAQTVAKSRYAKDTLVFVVEDDAQNGADHVDAHRSIALVLGPYVKRGAVVSERYTTVSLLRTIEDILGIPPLGLNDGLAEPMSEVFEERARLWSYDAAVPAILATTELPVPRRRSQAPATGGCGNLPPRDAAYWRDRLGDQDYRGEDRLDTERFNAELWRGRKAHTALPLAGARDLRHGRQALLAAYRARHGCAPR
jgi:DNA-binding beta-propeller fold protein YncE